MASPSPGSSASPGLDVEASSSYSLPASKFPPPWPPAKNSAQQDEGDRSTENSPLLSPTGGEQDLLLHEEQQPGDQDDTQATKSIWYLIAVTIGIGGLQVAWACELSNGTPYLLSLGLSKSLMALVWIAGPLTGTLVQPYVGMLSDNCRVSWGRRKPFMIGGALATSFCLLFIPWTKEIVAGVLRIFGADPASDGIKTFTIIVAVVMVYVLDIAVNTGRRPYA